MTLIIWCMISFWWIPFFRSRSLGQHVAVFIAQHRKIHPLFSSTQWWLMIHFHGVTKFISLSLVQLAISSQTVWRSFHTDFRIFLILFAFLILQILFKSLFQNFTTCNTDFIWFTDSISPFGPENSLEKFCEKNREKMTNDDGVQLCSI